MSLCVGVKIGHEETNGGWSQYPNSAGGVSVKGKFSYSGDKSIKYITLRFTPYNRVEDAVSCSIKQVSDYGLTCTGPYRPRETYGFLGENMWYNNSITHCKITRADIEFTDGTKESIPGSEITPMNPGGECYVATAVYGSYDCPEVWTLRRFRDNTLASSWYGRTFIHTYYAISPTLVKWFGNTTWFKNMWKPTLDKMVNSLNNKGVENTPYNDKQW